MKNRGSSAGFTVIEMMVVCAITIILMGLIFAPLIGSFNMTRRANAMVTAQDTARNTLDLVSRDLSQAMFIYDNSNSPVAYRVQQPPKSNGTPGDVVNILGLYGKIDIVLPKLMMHCNNPDHDSSNPREYERGDDAWPPCPYCGSTDVEMRPKQPLTPDTKIVRYFVGLKDPSLTPLKARDYQEDGGYPDNGFVLYRAEFDPVSKGNSADPADAMNLFPTVGKPDLDYPYFFCEDPSNPTAPNGQPYYKNWMSIAQTVGPAKDIDLVTLDLDGGGNIANVIPSVRFQLANVTKDTFKPAYITDEASESPYAIPTVFRASYGAWGSSTGTENPEMYKVSVNRGSKWYATGIDPSNDHFGVFDKTTGTLIFDITSYEASSPRTFPSGNPEIAFTVDPVHGEVRFDFPASDVIHLADIKSMNGAVIPPTPTRQYRITQFDPPPAGYVIVPGTEVVMGPDMSPGLDPSQVKMVRYQRVPFNLGDPGVNEYKIDYGLNPDDGYGVGWMVFSPSPDLKIPESIGGTTDASIDVSYRFQCNRDNDVVVGNYVTKSLMNVTLGIRLYDPNSGKLHVVTLSNKVNVRNLLR